MQNSLLQLMQNYLLQLMQNFLLQFMQKFLASSAELKNPQNVAYPKLRQKSKQTIDQITTKIAYPIKNTDVKCA